jgi:hypothetical protein
VKQDAQQHTCGEKYVVVHETALVAASPGTRASLIYNSSLHNWELIV